MTPVFDLRVFADLHNSLKVYIQRAEDGFRLELTPGQAAVVTSTFATNRTCYAKQYLFATFATAPEVVDAPNGKHQVRAWHLSVEQNQHDVVFYLGFAQKGTHASSGLPEKMFWVKYPVESERAPLIYAILQMRYVQLSGGVLSSSDIGDLASD